MSASDAEYAPIWDAEAAGPVEVGIDIIEIERVGQVLAKHGQRFLERVYTPRERERYGTRVQELAARFAAKEATMKALGTGIVGIKWREIEILPDRRGKPLVFLHGAARERADRIGMTTWAISLTHSRRLACAMVVALSAEPNVGD